MEFKSISLSTPSGVALALSNIASDVETVYDCIEDGETPEEICALFNKYLHKRIKWTVDRVREVYVRLVGKDDLGNINYLKIFLK